MKIKVYNAYDCVSDPDYVMAARIAVVDEEGNEHTVISGAQGYDIEISRAFIEELRKGGYYEN